MNAHSPSPHTINYNSKPTINFVAISTKQIRLRFVVPQLKKAKLAEVILSGEHCEISVVRLRVVSVDEPTEFVKRRL